MILLNFSHPLTPPHLAQVEALTGQAVERVVAVNSQIDPQQPLAPQAAALADACGLSAAEWQALLAELHGRCGYFPAHLRLRPVQGSLPPQYEVAEVLDLQAVRDAARRMRVEARQKRGKE
jgi:hypothetical protein